LSHLRATSPSGRRIESSCRAGYTHRCQLYKESEREDPKDQTYCDRIIFDTSTANLYYDADGAGGAAAIQIATLVDDHFAYNWGWSFSAADIVVV